MTRNIWKSVSITLTAALLATGFTAYAGETEAEASGDNLMLYVGSWGSGEEEGNGEGVYAVSMDPETGEMELVDTLETPDPGIVALSPDGRYLYAINEISNGLDGEWGTGGGLTAMAVQDDGSLELINQTPSLGALPCYVEVDPTGQYVLEAIHGSFDVIEKWVEEEDGTFTCQRTFDQAGISLFKVQDDGSVQPVDFLPTDDPGSYEEYRDDPEKIKRGYPGILPGNPGYYQTHSFIHCVAFDESGLFFASDRGTDQVYVLEIDKDNDSLVLLDKVKVDLGQAPRHMEVNREDNRLYLCNEIESSVSVFEYDQEEKSLNRIQTATVTEAEENTIMANSDIHLDPSGKHLYVSVRGTNTISILDVDENDGTVSLKEEYPLEKAEPRGFNITPDGRFMIVGHRYVDELEVFRIEEDGTLTPTGITETVGSPCSVRILAG